MYVLMLFRQPIKIKGLIRFSPLEGMYFGSRHLSSGVGDLDTGLWALPLLSEIQISVLHRERLLALTLVS